MRVAARGLLLFVSLCAGASPASAGPPQWPSWPSAVDRDAAPLMVPDLASHDRDRTAAVFRLQRYPTPLIEDALVHTLTHDPSAQVIREALRLCYLRRAEACLEPAVKVYKDERNGSLRAPALRVLATDPQGERLDLLLKALLDPSNAIRAEAAQLAGWAPLRGEAQARTQRALLAKLSDSSSSVRERAVTALGLQGAHDGTLAIARLLEDPEPDVRAAAATALGRGGDPKATAALRRALEGQNEGNVTRAMLVAFARLPGPEVAAALLEYLDAPPPGVGASTVAEAIGDRVDPETALIDGLIERLRAPSLESAASLALLLLGPSAVPRIQAALERGLGARLDTQLRGLLAAAELPENASTEPTWPDADDVSAWQQRLRVGKAPQRLAAAAALGELAPAWLPAHVEAVVRSAAPERARPWVLALAMTAEPVRFRDDDVLPWARLATWAHDRTLSETDRCMATLALGRADQRGAAEIAEATFERLIGDHAPRMRACATWAARTVAPELTALALLDADARPRAAAAAATSLDVRPAIAARRAHLAQTDPDPHVREAASQAAPSTDRLTLVLEPLSPAPWATPSLWNGASPVLGTRPGPWVVAFPSPSTSR